MKKAIVLGLFLLSVGLALLITETDLVPRLGIGSSAACPSNLKRSPQRHGTGSRPRNLEEGLKRRACSLTLRASRKSVPAQAFEFDLIEASDEQFPGIVDSNSPAYWENGRLMVVNSAWAETFRSSGDSVETLSDPVKVELPGLSRPGIVWMEAIWRDPVTALLYGWYHFEPADLICQTAPIVGAAVSYDEGLTWEDRGFVLENGYGVDCDYDNGYFTGGTGDFSVILGAKKRYLYFVFTNYAGPIDQQGIGIARSAVDDKGQPGTVFKYYGSAWNEPGLGGRSVALLPSSTGWKGPFVEAFWGPSVHWNSYLKSYVGLLNHTDGENWDQEGIYISFSQDLLKWTPPMKILESNYWYPQVIGLGPDETDSLAGQSLRLYVGGISSFILEFKQTAANNLPSRSLTTWIGDREAVTGEVNNPVVLRERRARQFDLVGRYIDNSNAPVAVNRLRNGSRPKVRPISVEDDDT